VTSLHTLSVRLRSKQSHKLLSHSQAGDSSRKKKHKETTQITKEESISRRRRQNNTFYTCNGYSYTAKVTEKKASAETKNKYKQQQNGQ
jgi:hypothetical protein